MRAKAPHVGVAYTYIYFITWLYRYAKYSTMDLQDTDISGIKEMLGYASTNKELNYIIRRNGVLDRLGITKTLTFKEAPVQWYLNEYHKDIVEWNYFEDMNDSLKGIGENINIKRRQIKEPLFATSERVVYERVYNGTFFDKEHTHQMPFEVFVECMTNPELGCTAFYIYGYLASRCGLNGGQIQVSIETIGNKTGIRNTTRDKALDALKKFRLIGCIAENFVFERGEHQTDSNTYWVYTDANWFTSSAIDYTKRRVIHISQHLGRRK
ncbi:hypothetical protein ACSS6N_12030 [Peribacillus frigoritolerans]|uniref:hypothetical protein n=1 Tax=Peribacillus frigoritolerans TaxID=450367 RepID=UPI003F830607